MREEQREKEREAKCQFQRYAGAGWKGNWNIGSGNGALVNGELVTETQL